MIIQPGFQAFWLCSHDAVLVNSPFHFIAHQERFRSGVFYLPRFGNFTSFGNFFLGLHASTMGKYATRLKCFSFVHFHCAFCKGCFILNNHSSKLDQPPIFFAEHSGELLQWRCTPVLLVQSQALSRMAAISSGGTMAQPCLVYVVTKCYYWAYVKTSCQSCKEVECIH